MKKFKDKLISLIPSKRKLIQLYCALLYNANIRGFSSGSIYKGDVKNLCVPGLNCYSCPGAVGACPLGTLQGTFSSDKSTWFYVGGIILLYCILFGRMICGWLCPFGLIQELLYKIKTPKLKKSPVTKLLSYLKYVILVFFVFIVPIMYAFRDTPLPTFCKYICPAGTLEGGISLLANKVNDSYFSMLGPLFTWKFLVLVSILVGSVFIFRIFCRFICPLGALYGLFNKISFFGVKVDEPKCINCNLCVNRCKLDVKKVGDRECISCGECINVCPTKAIVWKGPKLPESLHETVKGNEKSRFVTRAVSCVLLLALLIGSMVYFWKETEPVPVITDQSQEEQSSEIPFGTEIGTRCRNGELPIVTPEGFQTETINPAGLGKITVINFWGTWCTPCVNELPYFDRIASEYKDTVSVVAIHSSLGNDKAPEYIGKYYPESQMIFASDVGDAEYYQALGGKDAYPYTIILDENGVILQTFVKALEYEDLKTVIDNQLNK